MMASRTATKDIITLRGSAAIVSEFFGNFIFYWILLSFVFVGLCSVSKKSFADLCISYFFAIPLSGYSANR